MCVPLRSYSLEPLYEVVLSPAPYSLSVTEIGLFSSIITVGWVVGYFLVGSWAVIAIGDLYAQSVGACAPRVFAQPRSAAGLSRAPL